MTKTLYNQRIMNDIKQNRLPVRAESNLVIAETLLKGIGFGAVRLCRAGVQRVAESLNVLAKPADGSTEDPYVTYDSVRASEVQFQPVD